MGRSTLENMMEVEYILNARFLNNVYDHIDNLLQVIKTTPTSASVFLYKNKEDWVEEIEQQLKEIYQIKVDLSKDYFGSRNL